MEWVRKRVSLERRLMRDYWLPRPLWELRTENDISWFPHLLNDVPGIRLPRFTDLLISIHMPVFVLPFLTEGEKHFELMGTFLEAYLVCHKFCEINTLIFTPVTKYAIISCQNLGKNLLCKLIIENKCKNKCYQSFKFSLNGWTHSCAWAHTQTHRLLKTPFPFLCLHF